MNGLTVYINGKWYWFEYAEDLIDVLESYCNDAGYENFKECIIEYDN